MKSVLPKNLTAVVLLSFPLALHADMWGGPESYWVIVVYLITVVPGLIWLANLIVFVLTWRKRMINSFFFWLFNVLGIALALVSTPPVFSDIDNNYELEEYGVVLFPFVILPLFCSVSAIVLRNRLKRNNGFKNQPITRVYREYRFNLQCRVSDLKANLKLEYIPLFGFIRKENNRKTIEAQIMNMPLFIGTATDPEEWYLNRYVCGITFYEFKDLDQLVEEIETVSQRTFLSTLVSDPDISFKYLKDDEGMILTLKTVIRNGEPGALTAVSFYYGIAEQQVKEYLQYVN